MVMTQEQDVMLRRVSFLMLGLMGVAMLILFLPGIIEASGTGTSIGALPWEKALGGIAFSLTGPVAKALSLIMVVIGVGVLMFGGDLAGWARWLAFAALAAGTLGGAANIISMLGVTGALI
ncbi:MAG: conjugal transfer protein [Fretibacterium sp.]|nr:conjugal transfer protein [Fretibacterium sp.]